MAKRAKVSNTGNKRNLQRLLLSGAALLAISGNAQQTAIYMDPSRPIEERVEDALSRMTTEEKVALLHAQSKFSSAGVPRLGIPENWASDGPHGVRAEIMWDEWYNADWANDSCVAFLALTCLAATWNPEMSAMYGKAIGEEARYRNKNILLGPGVNIYRTPLNGRNFEYMGEDPYLASIMVVPYIQEVQKNNVAACVKHFALNNQEIRRYSVNVNVDDRALYEIYLPAFKAAVEEGGAWAIMGAYNKYKGEHACHNQYLLNDILKGDWGFDGVVVSDWGGTHDTEQSIKNGLDMEFGSWTNGMNWNQRNAYSSYYLADPYLKLLKEGKVSDKELNEKARRVLRLVFRTNMAPNRKYGSFGTAEHGQVGRRIAEEGIVLLQNQNNLLPLNANELKNVLVVGENASKMMTIGGGSSSLKAKYEHSPLYGITNRLGDNVNVTYVQGYASPAERVMDFKDAKEPEKQEIDLAAMRAEAVAAAKKADVVIFVGGLNKNNEQDCEGNDRKEMGLPYGQDQLISELVKANPKTVVVIISGNAVEMPWVKQVPSIVEAWYSGSESGPALASVLFGDVNPSGKLPFTFPVKLTDNSAHAVGEYPGGDDVNYTEGIFVGYRYADKEKIKPLFPFGHGLSYTTFKYGKPTADKKVMSADDQITFTVPVTNTGSREGAEIVQLYIADKESSLPRPNKELKGFKKVRLAPGETQNVEITVDKKALSFYDDKKGEWVAEPGMFEAVIAASAEDIKGKVPFELK